MRPAVFLNPPPATVHLRPTEAHDLAALNAVIERAVMNWLLVVNLWRLTLGEADAAVRLGKLGGLMI